MSNKNLIISSWAPPDIGGPQSLYNLFSFFPEKSFAILTTYYTELRRKTGSWLPCDYYFVDHAPLPYQQERKIEAQRSPVPTKRNIWRERLMSLLGTIAHKITPIKNLYLVYHFYRKYSAFVREGKRVIQAVQPTTLIGISDVGPALLASYQLSKKYKKKLVYFLFDLYLGNNLEFPAGWFAKHYERKMFEHAELVIVTNEGTQQYYQKRYPNIRDRFVVVHNSVFVENYERTTQLPPLPPPFKIIFTGHVYWAQEQAVMNLISAMKKLQDLPLMLDLYVPNPYPKLLNATANNPNIRVTSAPPSQMPTIQGQATLLFLPLAWNTKAPDIIATATPGKFTDYLASGRPMLIHAPKYAYVSQYTKEHELGLVVDENSVEKLAQTIRDFLHNPEQGQHYVDNALRIFHQNHDARKNAKKLTELLNMV